MRVWREKIAEKTTAAGAKAGLPNLLAIIDVGTTAIRMDIAEIPAGGPPRVLETLQQAVNLGRDTFTGGRIRQTTIEECADVLTDFRQVMAEYGITRDDQIRAVGTSAILEAENPDAFLDRIYVATRINVVPVEQSEVNRLTYVALYGFLGEEPSLKEGKVLTVEVGGGSTKLLLVEDGHVRYSNTFRLGSLRMKETLEKHRTPADRIRALVEQHIQRVVDQMRQSVPADSVPSVVAIAGDMRMAMSRLVPDWTPRQTARLAPGAFSVVEKVAVTPADQLVRKHRIPYHEAETAGPTLLSYVRVARAFKAKQLIITGLSLRHGVLLDECARGLWSEAFAGEVLHSATALGEKFHYEREHCQHVADLCAKLFRELQPEHGMESRYEVILRTAAILHEIGGFVSNRSHHKHSMYLIMNGDLFGLSRRDVLLVALVARYHRRSVPRMTHEEYAELGRDDRIAVSKLAAILRVADSLERSHAQRVRDVVFAREGNQFVITVRGVEDVTLERLALEEKGGLFETVYGLKVILRTATAEGTV